MQKGTLVNSTTDTLKNLYAKRQATEPGLVAVYDIRSQEMKRIYTFNRGDRTGRRVLSRHLLGGNFPPNLATSPPRIFGQL